MDRAELLPVGWTQLAAVYEHGFAYARSLDFYNTVAVWMWWRLPGDLIFALGAVLMVLDFIIKLRPVFPRSIERLFRSHLTARVNDDSQQVVDNHRFIVNET